MPTIKFIYMKEIHVYKGSLDSLDSLKNFIKSSFASIPENFKLSYNDSEGDIISISCDQDVQSLEQEKGVFKIYI